MFLDAIAVGSKWTMNQKKTQKRKVLPQIGGQSTSKKQQQMHMALLSSMVLEKEQELR